MCHGRRQKFISVDAGLASGRDNPRAQSVHLDRDDISQKLPCRQIIQKSGRLGISAPGATTKIYLCRRQPHLKEAQPAPLTHSVNVGVSRNQPSPGAIRARGWFVIFAPGAATEAYLCRRRPRLREGQPAPAIYSHTCIVTPTFCWRSQSPSAVSPMRSRCTQHLRDSDNDMLKGVC